MHDLKIENALLVDGTGRPAYKGAVAVRDGRIAAIEPRIAATATRRIDAGGRVVCPGFIDVHTHTDTKPAFNQIRQGCTTLIGGACGFSPVDLNEVAKAFERDRPAHNLGMYIGHNAVREAVMGNEARAPEAVELERMKELAREGMREGAFALSAGLAYAPGCFSETEEIVEIARAAAEFGGFFDPHQRDEGDFHRESDEETLRVAREAGLPAHISHYKVIGVHKTGWSAELLAEIEKARAEGLDVTMDQYPYTASCARITLLFPKWACEGSYDDVLARLRNAETRARIKAHLVSEFERRFGGDGARLVISTTPSEKQFEGKGVDKIAQALGHPGNPAGYAETVMHLAALGSAVAGTDRGRLVMCVYHQMAEEDVVRIMKKPYVMVGSDGWNVAFGEGCPHPRCYGTFPRVLARYCREQGALALEEAVRKMTALPAWRLGLEDRGALRVGAWADITIFDPQTVADKATYTEPHQYPEGIDFVIVNGQVVIDEGEASDTASGKFLRRGASTGAA